MSVDSRNEQGGMSLEWVKDQLRRLSVAEPPGGLKERLRADIPNRSEERASRDHIRWWPRVTGWAGIAVVMVVLCGVLQLWTPVQPSVGPEPDAADPLGIVLAVDHNSILGQVPAADYNSVRPPDVNALDSNSLQ